jgi:predicted nuclease with TOPRIM domain
MSYDADLHEALAHWGLVTETDPLLVCSTDYRTRFREAVYRACDGMDPDYMKYELEQELKRSERLLSERDSAEEDARALRDEVSSLKRDIGRLEDELADVRQSLDIANRNQGAA